MLRLLTLASALLLQTAAARVHEPEPAARAGDVYEVRWESTSSKSSSDGSSGSTESRYMLAERVIAVRDTGVEVEFDLPPEAPSVARAGQWQFPARVLRPPSGPLKLLNRSELEARLERWLQAAGLPREACGRWYFTWNAFQIECDPDSVIDTLAAFDLRPGDLREGAVHHEAGALRPAVLRREASDVDRATFVVEMEVDPEAALRQRAEVEAVVAEISGDNPQLRAAREAMSAQQITGTIRITFERNPAGRVTRRTKVTEVEVLRRDGERERETWREVVERRLVPGRGR